MPRASTDSARVLGMARKRTVLRSRDVAAQGIHTGTLTRLARAGILERVGAGRYRLAQQPSVTEQHDFVVAATSVPHSVVCLTSALQFHGIGKQLPAEVWLAVPRGTRVPRLSTPPLRVVRVAQEVFDLGVEDYRVEGQTVRIYGVARTIADCFRFRNKVGLDVALEALAEAWRAKRLNLDELHRIATALRVQRVMQPYLEAIVL